MQRIALYSQDTHGLGRMRRNIAIARALAADEPRAILLISGAGEGAGDGDVATHPAEAVCVLGVEGDSLHGLGGLGCRTLVKVTFKLRWTLVLRPQDQGP